MTKNLTEGEPAKLIFFFTLPLIAGNIFQQMYALVDTFIVGRFLGVEALAAVGCTGSLMFFMLGFIVGITSGFSIYTGQRFGAKDEQGVRQSAAACTVLSFACSLILTLIGVPLCRPMLLLMQTPPEILDGAYDFISIVYGGLVMFFFLLMQTNIIRALGDSRTPTIILAIALCVNIILEPVAILILEWGIPGAALATIVSQFVGNLVCFLYILKKLPILHVRREDWKLTKKILWAHLRIGLPMGFQTSIIAIGAVILQYALNQLGPIAVAAYAASQKVDAIAVMPMMSFGTAMAAYTAQNYGARKFERIEEGVRKCIYMSCGFSVFAGLLVILSGPYVMHMFVGDGQQQVIDYGETYFIVNGVCYWLLALLFIYRFTLQGLGQSAVPTIAGIIELFMRMAAALLLVDLFGFVGACMGNPLAWVGALIPIFIAYISTRRRLRRAVIREKQLHSEA